MFPTTVISGSAENDSIDGGSVLIGSPGSPGASFLNTLTEISFLVSFCG